MSQNNCAKYVSNNNINGRLSNGIIQHWERASSLHAADASKQNINVDRADSCQCCGLLRYRSFHVAQALNQRFDLKYSGCLKKTATGIAAWVSKEKSGFSGCFVSTVQWRQPSIVKGGVNDVRTNFKWRKPTFHAKGVG